MAPNLEELKAILALLDPYFNHFFKVQEAQSAVERSVYEISIKADEAARAREEAVTARLREQRLADEARLKLAEAQRLLSVRINRHYRLR
jgi:hypothetical protein